MSSHFRRRLRVAIGESDSAAGSLTSQAEPTNNRRDEGLALLRKHISTTAFQEPSPIPDPDSLSETDQAIIDHIKTWLHNAERRRKFLRIGESSFQGSTTSSISNPLTAEEVEEVCRDGCILGASFSFSRRAAAAATTDNIQDDAQKARMTLIPTLAYQLAHNIPEIQDSIASVALNDLSVFTRSIVSQMMELIVKPLLRLTASPAPRVVVIEGLNSMEGSGTKEVVEAITQCLAGYEIPIGFVLVLAPSVGGVKMPRRYPRVTRQ